MGSSRQPVIRDVKRSIEVADFGFHESQPGQIAADRVPLGRSVQRCLSADMPLNDLTYELDPAGAIARHLCSPVCFDTGHCHPDSPGMDSFGGLSGSGSA